jgi:cysteine-rich repeat protein
LRSRRLAIFVSRTIFGRTSRRACCGGLVYWGAKGRWHMTARVQVPRVLAIGWLATLTVGLLFPHGRALGQGMCGDCNGDFAITLAECQLCADIAVGRQELSSCLACDCNQDGLVTINEVVACLQNTTCGDGVVDPGEECDDGNRLNGDGCNIACEIEPCYACAGQPSACSSICTATPTSTPTPTPTSACGALPCTVTPTTTPVPNGVGDCDGNGIVTPQLHASQWTVIVPMHDTVVVPVRPLTVTIPRGTASVAKNVHIRVRNADIVPMREPQGHQVLLTIDPGDCPEAIFAGGPDFDRAPGSQASTLVQAGKTKTATIPLVIPRGLFSSFNRLAPARCTFAVTATTLVAGNIDPNPSNDAALVEVNVIDLNQAPGTVTHESVLASVAPITIDLAAGDGTLFKTVKAKVTNADLGETPGHAISLAVMGGNCPWAVQSIDLAPRQSGAQDQGTVAGGKSANAKVRLAINPLSFKTANAKSPARCVAVLVASDPTGNIEPDSPNNITHLVIDVIDKSDFAAP